MWISRTVLLFSIGLSILLACLVPSPEEPSAMVTGRELLELTQRAGGGSYTFDLATAQALRRTQLPRPAADATLQDLELGLIAAGFELRPTEGAARSLVRLRQDGG